MQNLGILLQLPNLTDLGQDVTCLFGMTNNVAHSARSHTGLLAPPRMDKYETIRKLGQGTCALTPNPPSVNNEIVPHTRRAPRPQMALSSSAVQNRVDGNA